ncbi:MAG: hypothetical protein R3C61_16680 [Bacteroidia bacterium]
MNTFEPIDKDRLRNVDVMIAYLTDTASEKDVEAIEALMEEDELYRLSMEELAGAVAADPQVARAKVLRTEAALDELLLSGKDAFVAQLVASKEDTDLIARFRKTPFIYRFFGVIAGLTIATLLIWLPLRKPNLPFDPAANLIIGEDLQMGTLFVKNCDNKGIGRPEGEINAGVSVSSALLDNYAEGNFDEAALQFAFLMKQGSLSDSCVALASFYQAKSYMAAGKNQPAIQAFSQTINQIAAKTSVIYASHWYIANLQLVEEDYQGAREHFRILAALDSDDKHNHLPSLLAKNYLTRAQQFLEYMK